MSPDRLVTSSLSQINSTPTPQSGYRDEDEDDDDNHSTVSVMSVTRPSQAAPPARHRPLSHSRGQLSLSVHGVNTLCSEGHRHKWPTVGTVCLEPCQKKCGYCKAPLRTLKGLRKHVLSHRTKDNLNISVVVGVARDCPTRGYPSPSDDNTCSRMEMEVGNEPVPSQAPTSPAVPVMLTEATTAAEVSPSPLPTPPTITHRAPLAESAAPAASQLSAESTMPAGTLRLPYPDTPVETPSSTGSAAPTPIQLSEPTTPMAAALSPHPVTPMEIEMSGKSTTPESAVPVGTAPSDYPTAPRELEMTVEDATREPTTPIERTQPTYPKAPMETQIPMESAVPLPIQLLRKPTTLMEPQWSAETTIPMVIQPSPEPTTSIEPVPLMDPHVESSNDGEILGTPAEGSPILGSLESSYLTPCSPERLDADMGPTTSLQSLVEAQVRAEFAACFDEIVKAAVCRRLGRNPSEDFSTSERDWTHSPTVEKSFLEDKASSWSRILLSSTARKHLLWSDETYDYLTDFVKRGHPEGVKMLLEEGCNPGRSDNARMKPMLNAIRGRTANHHKCMKMLIDKGADVNAVSKSNGMTYLHYAVSQEFWSGYATTVSILLEANADPNMVDKAGNTPLLTLLKGRGSSQGGPLTREERDALVVFLNRNSGTRINVRNPRVGENVLHMAIRRHDSYTLEAVLGQCKYPDLKNQLLRERTPHGFTPLLLVMNVCHFTTDQAAGVALRLLELLLQSGARPDDVDTSRGDTALHYIVGVHRSTDALDLLLRHKADALVENARGVSACTLLRERADDYPYDPWYALAIKRMCECDQANTPGPGPGPLALILKSSRPESPELTPPQSPTMSS